MTLFALLINSDMCWGSLRVDKSPRLLVSLIKNLKPKTSLLFFFFTLQQSFAKDDAWFFQNESYFFVFKKKKTKARFLSSYLWQPISENNEIGRCNSSNMSSNFRLDNEKQWETRWKLCLCKKPWDQQPVPPWFPQCPHEREIWEWQSSKCFRPWFRLEHRRQQTPQHVAKEAEHWKKKTQFVFEKDQLSPLPPPFRSYLSISDVPIRWPAFLRTSSTRPVMWKYPSFQRKKNKKWSKRFSFYIISCHSVSSEEISRNLRKVSLMISTQLLKQIKNNKSKEQITWHDQPRLFSKCPANGPWLQEHHL